MNADELIRALEEYRRITKASEEDVLVQLAFHVIEIKSRIVNVELGIRVLMARETYGKESVSGRGEK